ncbi:unnamed protein product [Mucor hiemalis]
MQLSEEPVWFRDLNALPSAHIILLEEDFKTAIQEERKRTLQFRTNEDIRQEYVQHLLANVPKDTKGKFEIIEKTATAPPSPITKENGVYDSIEGYRIEVKKDGEMPSTFVLKKKNEEELRKEKEEKRLKAEEEERLQNTTDDLPPDDPDALFETMMMLKDMNMDKDDGQSVPAVKEPVNPPVSTVKHPVEVKKDITTVKREPVPEAKEVEKVTFDVKEESKAPIKPVEDTNVTKVTAEKPKKAVKKKKKAVPELSLFGTIWTILDHLTTKATRIYLSELQNNHHRVDVNVLLAEDESMVDSVYLRGQIFSERILETYGIIRTQLDIQENLEDDIVNVIKTFRFSDASMVALNPAQSYMVTLVLIKALADILLSSPSWKKQFELCCNTIDQSTDTIDACVRVLKIASV